MGWLLLSTVMILINWGAYVWATTQHHTLEASLGYYINPLLNMVAGLFLFRERIDKWGWIAIGSAAVGVVLQTLALGRAPWMSILIALSFAAYGVIRKRVAADAQTGLFVECLLMIPFGAAMLIWLSHAGQVVGFASPGTVGVVDLQRAGDGPASGPVRLVGAAAAVVDDRLSAVPGPHPAVRHRRGFGRAPDLAAHPVFRLHLGRRGRLRGRRPVKRNPGLRAERQAIKTYRSTRLRRGLASGLMADPCQSPQALDPRRDGAGVGPDLHRRLGAGRGPAAIQRDLGAGPAAVQWVSNAYLLTLGALVLIGGAAGDRFGRRRVFLIGVAVFTLASIACGLAPNVQALIGARAVQGIGAALLTPGALAVIGATFPPEERGKAFGTWAGAGAIFGMVGPLVGGWLADHADWRAIFWINVPLAIVAVLISLKFVPESRDEDAKGLDWLGALLAIVGLGALTWGLTAAPDLGMGSPLILGALVGGVRSCWPASCGPRRGRNIR
jgi:hypothetical protein